jgi:hypothetical protein
MGAMVIKVVNDEKTVALQGAAEMTTRRAIWYK